MKHQTARGASRLFFVRLDLPLADAARLRFGVRLWNRLRAVNRIGQWRDGRALAAFGTFAATSDPVERRPQRRAARAGEEDAAGGRNRRIVRVGCRQNLNVARQRIGVVIINRRGADRDHIAIDQWMARIDFVFTDNRAGSAVGIRDVKAAGRPIDPGVNAGDRAVGDDDSAGCRTTDQQPPIQHDAVRLLGMMDEEGGHKSKDYRSFRH